MIEKFRAELCTDELRKRKMYGLEWVLSAGHISMIRVYDFDIESLIKQIMVAFVESIINDKSPGKHDIKIKDQLEEMLNNNEIVKYKKIILGSIDRKKFYTHDPDKMFGYHGNTFADIKKVFGNNFDLFLPDGVAMLGYAIYENDYIILFAPLIHENQLDEYIDLTVENIKTFDNDALF